VSRIADAKQYLTDGSGAFGPRSRQFWKRLLSRIRDQITRRQAAALTVLAVVLTVAVAALVRDGGSEGTKSPGAAVAPAEPTFPPLGKRTVSKALGVEVQQPRGWVTSRSDGTIRLRTRDRSTQVVISAPARRR
jgi:hypothetical protein